MSEKSLKMLVEAKEIVRRLQQAKEILVMTHARADGDALGSALALCRTARQAGKKANALLPDSPPERYNYLLGDEKIYSRDDFESLAACADAIIIIDTCAYAQLDGLQEQLCRLREKIVVIDHHATADNIGAVRWIDPSAAAAGILTLELIEALGWKILPHAAEELMTAVTTDTGWLRFANTDGRCLRAAARLVDAGVKPDALYKKIYQADRPERLQLLVRVLESMEFYCDSRLAVMSIRREDFDQTGARPDETENMVNEALRLKAVEVAILLVENTDCIRVSLRSRGGLNVAELARQFGGGGHPQAAGLRVNSEIESIKKQLIEACSKMMQP